MGTTTGWPSAQKPTWARKAASRIACTSAGAGGPRPGCRRSWVRLPAMRGRSASLRKDDDNRDDERIERQRFDQRQAEDDHGANGVVGAGIARQAVGAMRGGHALADAAETGGDSHAQDRGQGLGPTGGIGGGGIAGGRRLRKERRGGQNAAHQG